MYKNNFIILIFLIAVIVINPCCKNRDKGANSNPQDILLKNYKPESVFEIPETKVSKSMFPAIDAHSHAYVKTPEELAEWVKIMDEVGIEKTVILTMAVGEIFDSLYNEFSKYPGRFELWCSFDYTGYDEPGYTAKAVKELERCFRVGAKGVGELVDKGEGMYGAIKGSNILKARFDVEPIHFDDERLAPLLDKCGELGMPVSIHVADPYWMYLDMDSTNDGMMNAIEWRLDNKKGIIGHAGMIDMLERVVKRHPNTTFVTCHLGNCSYNLNKLGELLDTYPNLYADISARFEEIATIPRFAAKFFTKYQDRLLYGTDYGYNKEMYQATFRIYETEDDHFYSTEIAGYHWPQNGLGLDSVTLKKIYRENALKIFLK